MTVSSVPERTSVNLSENVKRKLKLTENFLCQCLSVHVQVVHGACMTVAALAALQVPRVNICSVFSFQILRTFRRVVCFLAGSLQLPRCVCFSYSQSQRQQKYSFTLSRRLIASLLRCCVTFEALFELLTSKSTRGKENRVKNRSAGIRSNEGACRLILESLDLRVAGSPSL